MILQLVATLATGLFAGAAIYISVVEHPARMSCGPEVAVREFRPSYKRGTLMQASLAMLGSLSGLAAGWQYGDVMLVAAALLIGTVVPFTLLVILPTNERLLDPSLNPTSDEAWQLLRRWGRLHALRSTASTLAFVMFLARLAAARTT